MDTVAFWWTTQMHKAADGEPYSTKRPPEVGKKKQAPKKPYFTKAQIRDATAHGHRTGHFPDP